MTDWYDDDSFWETFQNYMFDPRRLGLAVAEVDQMIALLGLQSGAGVLDLCSGIGRESIEHCPTWIKRARAPRRKISISNLCSPTCANFHGRPPSRPRSTSSPRSG